jgi:methylmalonyl-CoA mutase N-terminal domain/subunit
LDIRREKMSGASFIQSQLQSISKEKQEWLKKRYSQRVKPPEVIKTLSGIPVAPLYTPSDIPSLDYLTHLGFPGEEPFTRGVYPTMYRGQKWTMRQLAGFGTPEDTNRRLRLLLGQGATGLNITFDYPTLRGYDSDDLIARADAGRGGVAIDSLRDMEALFESIPIDKVSVSLVSCNPSTAVSLLSMYFVCAQLCGLELSALAGTTQNDFLMETAITNAPEVISPRHSFKLSCDIVEFCIQNAPKWNPVNYAGYNYREAGVTAIQETALVLCNAIAYTEELINRDWKVDDFAPRLSFFFSAHNDFFEEIAKYRAARRVWYKIMKEKFKAKAPRSYTLRFHVQTAGVSLTAQQPLNNITRAAYQALAAVFGGAQSIHVDSYDEALCTPTEQAALVALRTQQILQYETGVASTIDPLGGSYYVEFLTNEIEQRIWKYMEKIDQMGGIVSATEKGWIHREISNSACEYQKAIDSGEYNVVGVNCFKVEEEPPVEIFVSPETVERQKIKLQKLRKERDYSQIGAALNKVREKCCNNENVMPVVMEAVKAGATLGEITRVFREEFGTWRMLIA